MRAVVTAGGLVDRAFADAIGTPVKALAYVGPRTLLDTVLDACEGAGVDGVAVVGGAAVRAHLAGRDVRVIDADTDGRVNLLRALEAWPDERFLFLTSDMPFVTANALRDVMDRSAIFALTMALADARDYHTRFPGAQEHTLVLGGERIANGNAFLLAPEAVAPARELATRFFTARKSLVRMALLLGPGLIARFALKRLAIADLEAYATRTLGVGVSALRGCDPGLCYDVDDLADLTYARTVAQRSAT